MTGAAALGAGCFVTGTDTEVGKTRISAALVHWAAAQGRRSAGYKPVAAGMTLVEGQRANEDVRMLQAASSVPLDLGEVGPLQLDAACAPHIAASLQGVDIDIEALVRGARALRERADLLVVEGVGGFCVPLGPAADSADLAVALGLPVVLVVGLRLGCLNHALLTAEAIRARGLALAGWIGNRIDPGMPYADENLATLRHELRRRHQAPCLGVVPWLPPEDGPARVAAHFDVSALADRLGIRASRRAAGQR
jgi:dethiobiotin synthetase